MSPYRNYGLNFISDEILYNHVKETADKYRFCVSLSDFNKNLIDPIKLTFDAKVYGKDIKDVIENEVLRQIDKSNTNHIGYFHQNIFKYINSNWDVPANGFDIVNEDEKIFVEMKNKHNTMNSSSSQKTYMRMQNKILEDSNAICMLVEVIARNSQNITWVMSIDGQRVSNDRIRRVSIDKFYELVTGETDAFKKLCEHLPSVLEDVISSMQGSIVENKVFDELYRISPDILKSLYLLSFEKYEGFDSFQIN